MTKTDHIPPVGATDLPVGEGNLFRTIGWKDAFWMASGVPALVLFSIGGIAATVGSPSWIIWMISVSFEVGS